MNDKTYITIEYFFFSLIWFLGILTVMFLGYYLGTLKTAFPDAIVSPFDSSVRFINTEYTFNYTFADEKEMYAKLFKRILIIQTVVAILALALLEIGGRVMYDRLKQVKIYRNELLNMKIEVVKDDD